MERKDRIAAILDLLPHKPGVYRFFNEEHEIIYIGKAKSLKNRVSSYFQGKDHSVKTRQLVKLIDNIEYTVVNSEYDALLLENNLIKQYHPKYNIALRDDKTYPHLLITNERFPRIIKTRRIIEGNGEYFGPYSKLNVPHTILSILEKVFFVRTCKFNLSEDNISKKKYKVCMEYHIRKCLGPCEGLQLEDDYLEKIEQCRNVLKGDFQSSLKFLKVQMEKAASALEFEKAGIYKSKIEILKGFQKKSEVMNPKLGDLSVFTIISTDTKAFVNYLKIRNGNIIKSRNFEYKKTLDEPDHEVLLLSIIDEISDPKEHILTNIEFPDNSYEINYQVPQRGDKKNILDLSLKNAIQLKNERTEYQDKDSKSRILEELKDNMRLTELPVHIECFDNSNIQGTNPVASMVCFKFGKPSKKDYRHFKIKTVIGPNDFDSMSEIVYRRYKRLLDEEKSLPQLILIDGGKGQLSAALKSIRELGIERKVTVVGIAKRLEEIYYPGDNAPLLLSKKSESLKLLQQLRNEAHRFAITFHRDLRSKEFSQSSLDAIDGIGPKTKSVLLKEFKSIRRIKDATTQELEQLIGKQKTQLVQAVLKKES